MSGWVCKQARDDADHVSAKAQPMFSCQLWIHLPSSQGQLAGLEALEAGRAEASGRLHLL